MIHANCRARLTADDFDFIVRALSVKTRDSLSLEQLLVEEDTRDSLLEHDTLAAAILDSPERLNISPHLFFYVLCRRVLKDTPVSSREATDYIASLLEGFSRTAQLTSPDPSHPVELRYVTDMMLALQRATPHEAFLLRAHIANYTLFISGIFAENIGKRAQRGAPDISFYEAVGRSNFQAAAQHRDAHKLGLEKIYRELADGFRDVRLALNDLADRLLHLERQPTPLFG